MVNPNEPRTAQQSNLDFLTRTDIADILKISLKQAGRLMNEMPTVTIGVRAKRVSRADFERYLERKKQESVAFQERVARVRETLRSGRRGSAVRRTTDQGEIGIGPIYRKPRPLPPL